MNIETLKTILKAIEDGYSYEIVKRDGLYDIMRTEHDDSDPYYLVVENPLFQELDGSSSTQIVLKLPIS